MRERERDRETERDRQREMLTDKTYRCSKLYLTGNSRVLKRNNA